MPMLKLQIESVKLVCTYQYDFSIYYPQQKSSYDSKLIKTKKFVLANRFSSVLLWQLITTILWYKDFSNEWYKKYTLLHTTTNYRMSNFALGILPSNYTSIKESTKTFYSLN